MKNNKERMLNREKFSLAHLTLIEQSIFELIKIAEEAGYDYVSPRLLPVVRDEEQHNFLQNSNAIADCKKLLNDSRVKVLDVELFAIKPSTHIVNDFEAALAGAAEIKARYLIAQVHDKNLERASKKFMQLCELAMQYNLEVVLEMLPWSPLSTLHDTHSFLNELDLPNTGILFDLLHVYRANVKPEEIGAIKSDYFKFLHLCDAKGGIIDNYNQQKHIAREARYPAGRGDIPVLSYLDQMPVHKYSLEIPNERLHRYLGPQEYASYILEDSKNYLLLADCWRVKSKYFSVPETLI